MDFSGYMSLFVFLALNMAAAASGAFFKPGDWYDALHKPRWNPPNWLFPPAWSVLYLLIAIAGWRVYEAGGSGVTFALVVYFVSLGLNAGWSFVFFGLKRPDLALIELIGLWLSIAASILVFLPIDRTAGLLLLPYLAWVTFAGVLNASIWQLNRGPAGQGPG